MRQLRETWWVPIAAGAVVGLITGFVGMSIDGHRWLAMIGAVCGGSTAAALADRSVVEETLVAIGADVTSSVAFFLLVVGVFLLGARDLITAAGVGTILVVFGSIVAIPVGIVSAVIAAASGFLTSLAKVGIRTATAEFSDGSDGSAR